MIHEKRSEGFFLTPLFCPRGSGEDPQLQVNNDWYSYLKRKPDRKGTAQVGMAFQLNRTTIEGDDLAD